MTNQKKSTHPTRNAKSAPAPHRARAPPLSSHRESATCRSVTEPNWMRPLRHALNITASARRTYAATVATTRSR